VGLPNKTGWVFAMVPGVSAHYNVCLLELSN